MNKLSKQKERKERKDISNPNKMASDGHVHRSLPDELLFEIFSRMSPYSLGRAACVCRNWRYTIRNSVFWRNACLMAWQISGTAENYGILQSKYDGSWRKMWLLRPRVRTDGLYVSQNTYTHAGAAEQKNTNPIHVFLPRFMQPAFLTILLRFVVLVAEGDIDRDLVCYYRYIRFYHCGSFLYKVEGAIIYPGKRPTLRRIRLSLNGTTIGANNRMDILAFVTSSVNANEVSHLDEDILGVIQGWQEYAAHSADTPVTLHKSSQSPFVFVPFEEVETSFFNLPVEETD